MKRFLAMILAIMMTLSLCACGGGGGSSASVQLGTTVSTDIVDFSMDNCEFTFAVSGTGTNYMEPVDATSNTIYVSSTGTCYVSMTFTILNKNRGGSLNVGVSHSGGWPLEWKVSYGGKKYPVRGFDVSNNNGQADLLLQPAAILDKPSGTVLDTNSSRNMLLYSNEKVTLRMIGVLQMEPKSLSDSFEITVNIPTSSGKYEMFKYTVPAKS